MRPPSKGWYTHDEQIRAELDNLRKALNEARSRGMSDVVNNKYPRTATSKIDRCKGAENMSIKVKKPEVKMNLYETDKDVLKSFITNEKIDGVFTEKYLILQNFADDCRFSSDIQPELMEYLLPFYLRIIEEAIMHQNKMAEVSLIL